MLDFLMSFFSSNRPFGNVLNADDFIKEYPYMNQQVREAFILNPQLGSVRKIAGDGNCYYRALSIGVLEQMLLSQGDERQARFSYLAAQFQQLITDDVLPDEYISNVRQVIAVFNDAAQGRALATYAQLEEFLVKFDLDLIMVMRSALANASILNHMVEINGLTLNDSLQAENITLEQYLQTLLTMNAYAEGFSVDSCFLNKFLGANIHNGYNTNADLVPHDVNGFEPLPLYLFFQPGPPGHYDLFQTQETYQRLRRAADRSYRVLNVPSKPAGVSVNVSESKSKSVPQSKPAPVAQPNPAVVAQPNPAVVAQPNPAVVAQPDPAVVAQPDPAVVAQPNPAVVAQPNPAVVAHPNPAVVAQPKSVVVAQPKSVVSRLDNTGLSSVISAKAENHDRHGHPIKPKMDPHLRGDDHKGLKLQDETVSILKSKLTSLQTSAIEKSVRKPNHVFILSVFAAHPASRVVAAVLLLAGLALLGTVSFGVIPLAIGISIGVSCVLVGVGIFALGRNRIPKEEVVQATLNKL